MGVHQSLPAIFLLSMLRLTLITDHKETVAGYGLRVASYGLRVKNKIMKSYKDLEIYNLSYDLGVKIHKMSLQPVTRNPQPV